MNVLIDTGTFSSENEKFHRSFIAAWADSFPRDRLLITRAETGIQHPAIIEIPANRGKEALRFSTGRKFYDYALPSIAENEKADVFLTFSGYGSLRLNIPQVMANGFSDPEATDDPNPIRRWLAGWRMKRVIKKSQLIIFPSVYTSQSFLQKHPGVHFRVIVPGVDYPENELLGTARKEMVRNNFTSGREFFLFTGPMTTAPEIVQMLKAFSAFKKRQHTHMPLVFASRQHISEELKTLIATYKFRDELRLFEHIPAGDFQSLRAAAYAAVFPCRYPGFEIDIIQTVAVKTPVLCTREDVPGTLTALPLQLFDPERSEEINSRMTLIYKEETLRRRISEEGFQAVQSFNWVNMVRRYREIFSDLNNGGRIP